MAKEIERKFLVKSDAFLDDAVKVESITQAYLNDKADIGVFATIDKGYIEVNSTAGCWAFAINSEEAEEISQNDISDLTVRIRSVDFEHAFLTVKGLSTEDGLERDEWEYPISIETYYGIAKGLELEFISKERFFCPLGDLEITVDDFSSPIDDELFALAEIEFPVGYNHSQPLVLPDWIGEEVTGNVNYYNSVLIKSGKIKTGVYVQISTPQ